MIFDFSMLEGLMGDGIVEVTESGEVQIEFDSGKVLSLIVDPVSETAVIKDLGSDSLLTEEAPGDVDKMTFSKKGVEASKDGTFKVRGKVQSKTGPVAKAAQAVLDAAEDEGLNLDNVLDTDDDEADIRPFEKYQAGKKAPSSSLEKPTDLGRPGIYGVFEDGKPESPLGVYQIDANDIERAEVKESRKRLAQKSKKLKERVYRSAGFKYGNNECILGGGTHSLILVPNGVALIQNNNPDGETLTVGPNVGETSVDIREVEEFAQEVVKAFMGTIDEEEVMERLSHYLDIDESYYDFVDDIPFGESRKRK